MDTDVFLFSKQSKKNICVTQVYGLVEYVRTFNKFKCNYSSKKILFFRFCISFHFYCYLCHLFGVKESVIRRTDNLECEAPTIF